MKLTKEKYNELSARIDAGEFLVASPGDDVLPALPDNADDAMESFYADCQKVISSYKTKMEVYEQKTKAAVAAANAKGLADMANAVITDFDQKLMVDFEVYKQVAEERIKKLREDLAEAREISDNALKRCDDLSAKVEELDFEKSRFEYMYYDSDAKADYFEGICRGKKPDQKMEETLGIFLTRDDTNVADALGFVLANDDGNGEDEAVKQMDDEMDAMKEKDNEIRKLKEQLKAQEQEALAKMAFMMINNGIAYLVNINKVKEDQSTFGEKVLKHLLDGDCKMAIGDQNDDKLRSAISRISDKREAALDARNEQLENRARAAAQPATVHNEIKQVVVGDGKFLENPSAGDVTKFLEEE